MGQARDNRIEEDIVTARGHVRHSALDFAEVRRLCQWDRPFPPHAHDYPVIGLVRAGTRQLECDGARCTLRPGQLMVVNPGSVHSCTQEDDTPLTYDSMALTGLAACPRLRGPMVDDPEVVEAFENAFSLIDANAAAEETEEALWLLVDALADPASASEPADPDDRTRAARAMEAYLRAHLAAPVSLEDIARAAGLSRFGALRAFAACYHITPMRYLASLRVEAARDLLAAGVPCSEAAARTGFADQAHLTRTFRDRLGLTPAAYQRTVAPDTAKEARL